MGGIYPKAAAKAYFRMHMGPRLSEWTLNPTPACCMDWQEIFYRNFTFIHFTRIFIKINYHYLHVYTNIHYIYMRLSNTLCPRWVRAVARGINTFLWLLEEKGRSMRILAGFSGGGSPWVKEPAATTRQRTGNTIIADLVREQFRQVNIIRSHGVAIENMVML